MMKVEIIKYTLNFKFEAGTSRGTMTSKDSYFIKLYDQANPAIFGIGECSPLVGLSPDLGGDLSLAMQHAIKSISQIDNLNLNHIYDIIPSAYPALQFAFETAILDLQSGGRRILFNNDFTLSKSTIPINGLVWMGDKSTMLQRIKDKIAEGFNTIKIKIGAINFDDELDLIKHIRNEYSKDRITIRLDANGAFRPEEALGILDSLEKFDIHSIEQPIMAGNRKAMKKLCSQSPIPIALDEELIGVGERKEKIQLLENIKPAFIIIKPTLLGGLEKSKGWIELAKDRSIAWWITSALESNIGLNAIAQFTANYNIDMPQGLGTGQLFHNNIQSPLCIDRGYLNYDRREGWDILALG